jgi:hypothetical protein
MEQIILQSIIAGIFALFGVWLKHKLERNTANNNSIGKPPKVFISPSQEMRKGIVRVFVGFVIAAMFSGMCEGGTSSPVYTYISIFPLAIIMFGFFLIFKGFCRKIFS